MNWRGYADPMEVQTELWLRKNGIKYERHDHESTGLDFFLPAFNLYIEVKRFHTARISDQMARAENVIAIQGIECLRFLEKLRLEGRNAVQEP